ncbi:STAS/SEC14 domain-containing protein [Puniceibacterium confluentis]|uniref:STAS/SEC14 domain-containing protein n=1 Tax=Puniceibacterium confluentis TaxID=1958944 RepID=UPI001648FA08|nr:STAS/SEC14 domain-containing protein [Puniceibacterium confluentis]
MIEKLPFSRDNRLAFHFSGAVTEEDYTKILIPALEDAIAEHDNVRMLVRVDNDLTDYTLGALLEDARVGLMHWRGFDRVALVADKAWIRRAVQAFSIFMPCPVMVFALAEEDQARRWLSESLGSIHQTDLGGGVLHVQLLGKLDSSVYAEEEQDLNAFIRANDRFRLLLDLREFDGWQGLGAVADHLKLVRDHRHFVSRMAVVGSSRYAKLARRVSSKFINADVRHFDDDELSKAMAWISED